MKSNSVDQLVLNQINALSAKLSPDMQQVVLAAISEVCSARQCTLLELAASDEVLELFEMLVSDYGEDIQELDLTKKFKRD